MKNQTTSVVLRILLIGNESRSNSTTLNESVHHYQSQLSLDRVLYFSLVVTVLILISIFLICISTRLGNENSSTEVSNKDVQLCASSASMNLDAKQTVATGDSPNYSDDDLVESEGRGFDKLSDHENSFTHLLSRANRYHFINHMAYKV